MKISAEETKKKRRKKRELEKNARIYPNIPRKNNMRILFFAFMLNASQLISSSI
jgi:hypothetical protein